VHLFSAPIFSPVWRPALPAVWIITINLHMRRIMMTPEPKKAMSVLETRQAVDGGNRSDTQAIAI